MGNTREHISCTSLAVTGTAVVGGTLGVTGLATYAAGVKVDGYTLFVKKISIEGIETTETDSAYDLPDNSLLLDVLVNVTDGESVNFYLGLLSSETGGATNCFVNAMSLATAGINRPAGVATVGTNETYWSANYRGTSLSSYKVGTDAAGDFGLYHEKPYSAGTTTAKSISYKGSANNATVTADVYLVMALLD